MRKVLRWIGRIVGVIVLLVVVAVAAVYAISEYKLRRTYDVAVEAIPIPTDPASIAEGGRLAQLRGCYGGGCHGKRAEGRVLGQNWLFGTMITPDLTRAVHELSNRDLVRVIRHGVLPDGRSVTIMPSAVFYNLTDADLGKIIAFLRSLPPAHGKSMKVTFGPLARLAVVTRGGIPPAAAIDHHAPRPDPGDGSDPVALGRYLAKSICAQCHSPDLAPDMKIVADYSPEEFATLLRTLVTRDGRAPPPGMTGFNLTDDEIDALYVYLREALPKELAAAAKVDVDG